MKKDEAIEKNHEKKEWSTPSLQIIAFKNTKGGGPEEPPETITYNPTASP